MERLGQRLTSAQNALNTLDEVVSIQTPSTIERDATIQRFEYTFEAVWKAAKQYLADVEGIDVGSPKGVIRACREVGLFDDDDAISALEMVDERNLTVHTYNESLAEEIYEHIGPFAELLHKWVASMQERVSRL